MTSAFLLNCQRSWTLTRERKATWCFPWTPHPMLSAARRISVDQCLLLRVSWIVCLSFAAVLWNLGHTCPCWTASSLSSHWMLTCGRLTLDWSWNWTGTSRRRADSCLDCPWMSNRAELSSRNRRSAWDIDTDIRRSSWIRPAVEQQYRETPYPKRTNWCCGTEEGAL